MSAGFCAVYLSFRFAGNIILPFVFALVLALIVRKIADKLKSFTGLSTRAGGFVCLVLVYLLCISSLFFLLRFVITEISEFFEILPDLYNRKIQPVLNEIALKFSNGKLGNTKLYLLSNELTKSLADFAKNVSAKALSLIANVVLQLPQTLFSIFVCVLASFFICFDYQNIKNYIKGKLSYKYAVKINALKKVIKNTVVKMLTCYALLFFITFLQLFIGFLLLNIKHALVLSLIISLLDILPMLGVGTVLVPWAAACFAFGKIPLGIGLLCLFLIIVIVRNILEPKIIGKKMGIHPLVSLFAVYVGICTGGVLTAIFLLFLITIIKYLNTETA